MSGLLFGTTGKTRRTFVYGLAAMALIVGAVNIVNVTTIYHEQPFYGTVAPIATEVMLLTAGIARE